MVPLTCLNQQGILRIARKRKEQCRHQLYDILKSVPKFHSLLGVQSSRYRYKKLNPRFLNIEERISNEKIMHLNEEEKKQRLCTELST